jgi:hypothetical protein
MFTQAQIEREAEMYAKGAELDLDLALHFYRLAKGAEDRDDAVAYQRAYNGCMRSMRQSLGFLGRMRKQEREHARAEAAGADAQPSPELQCEPRPDPLDRATAVAEKTEAVRAVMVPRIRLEALDTIHERELMDKLGPRIRRQAARDGFLEAPVPVLAARLCNGLGIAPPGEDPPAEPSATPAPEPADSS